MPTPRPSTELDTDQQMRVHALHAAVAFNAQHGPTRRADHPVGVLADAVRFEDYLRTGVIG